jgi:hypothetical protein
MQFNRARVWLASLLAILSCMFMVEVAEESPVLLLPAALPAVAALLFHFRTLQSQLIARAAIWAPMMLAMLFAHLDDDSPGFAMLMVASGALALLVAGRVSEKHEPGSFRPAAYRKILTLSLMLALADTFTLWMWALFAILGGARPNIAMGFLVFAVITLCSVHGLFRLQMWGLVLNLLANIAIAIVFQARIIDVQELRLAFIGSAIVQLLLALPVLIGVLRRRPLEAPAWLERASRLLPPIALIGVIALAIQPLFGPSILLRLASWLLH